MLARPVRSPTACMPGGGRAPGEPDPPMCLLVHAAMSCDASRAAAGKKQCLRRARPCRHCSLPTSAAYVCQEPAAASLHLVAAVGMRPIDISLPPARLQAVS